MQSYVSKRGLIRLLVGALVVTVAMVSLMTASRAFILITPEEVAGERAKGEPPRVRGPVKGDIGGPDIVLVRPGSTDSIPSPLDIELQFVLKPPSKIVQNSLRVLYGFFGLDVTDRLAKHAELTPAGILARNASLPAGSHSITIEISDDRGRVGRKEFSFEIKN